MELQTLVVSALVHFGNGNHSNCRDLVRDQNSLADDTRRCTRLGMDGAIFDTLASGDETSPF